MIPKKIMGCQQDTFVKTVNMVVGALMVFMGFFNMFNFLGGGTNFILLFGFFFYQM